jgi:K+-sensing histidine kinase KdpD
MIPPSGRGTSRRARHEAFDQTTFQALIDAFPDHVLLADQAHKIIAMNQTLAYASGLDIERLLREARIELGEGTGVSDRSLSLDESDEAERASQKEVYHADTRSWMRVRGSRISTGASENEALCLYVINNTTPEKSMTQQLSRRLEQQSGLNLILCAVQAAQTSAQVLEAAIDHVLQISWLGVRTRAAGFLLRGRQLCKVVSRNLTSAVEQGCAQVGLGECLCGRVAKTGESIVCAHVDTRHVQDGSDHGDVVLPLKWQSQILGVLCFYLDAGQELDDHCGAFLETVASMVATAIGRLYYQSQLAPSERLTSVGLLAAGVAHEMKNPLRLVLAIVEWLAEDLPPILEDYSSLWERLNEERGPERASALMSDTADPRDAQLLQDMAQCTRSALDGARRVVTIVRDLGKFSRADDDQLSRVSLVDVMERAVTLSNHAIKYRAHIVREFQQIPQVLAHEGRLIQVFLNLLMNAAQAIDIILTSPARLSQAV